MKKLLPILSKKIKESFVFYSLGLILNKENRTCSKLAITVNKSHDFLYRFLLKSNLFIPIFPSLMLSIINHFSKDVEGWLILDDTFLSKVFSRLLEGVYTLFNNSMSRPEKGLCLVVLAWSNGKVTIPIAFDWYFPKEITGDWYKKKSKIAEKLISEYYEKVPYKYFLADAHYATRDLIPFMCEKNIKFVMKIPRSRKVKTTNNNLQLKLNPALKLLRNQRSAKMFGEYAGCGLYFSVQKRKDKSGEYSIIFLVSNMNLKAKEYLIIYDGRWNIEIMFRTLKQSLGLSQCQSRNLEYQKAHIYSSFFSYGFIQHEKEAHSFENSEVAIKYLSALKLNMAVKGIHSFSRNFDHVA